MPTKTPLSDAEFSQMLALLQRYAETTMLQRVTEPRDIMLQGKNQRDSWQLALSQGTLLIDLRLDLPTAERVESSVAPTISASGPVRAEYRVSDRVSELTAAESTAYLTALKTKHATAQSSSAFGKLLQQASADAKRVLDAQACEDTIPALQDEHAAHAIASSWRILLSTVVERLVAGDFQLSTPVPGVLAVAPDVAAHNQRYVTRYLQQLDTPDARLVPLSDPVWQCSCAQWMGTHWDILLDLCTSHEGVSDLVLSGKMTMQHDIPEFQVGLIYVP